MAGDGTADGEIDESANSSFVAMGDDGWLFVSSLLRCMVETLAEAAVVVVVAVAVLTLTSLLLWLTLAPSLCRIVMSKTLRSSCVMMIGGSSDQLLLAFNPDTPTGNHSLNVLISLTDSLIDALFVVESGRTTDSIIAGVGLMTPNSLVSPVEAAVTVIVSLLLPCDNGGADDDDDVDDGVLVLGDGLFSSSPAPVMSFELSASFFLTYVFNEFGRLSCLGRTAVSAGLLDKSEGGWCSLESGRNAGGDRKSGCSCEPIPSLSLCGKRGLGRIVLPGTRRKLLYESLGRGMSLCPRMADKFLSWKLKVIFGGRMTCGGGLLIF